MASLYSIPFKILRIGYIPAITISVLWNPDFDRVEIRYIAWPLLLGQYLDAQFLPFIIL